LTAADVDGYLMQGVWVFASAAARDAAVTSPQEGNFAYLKDTNVTTYYTGSAWANLDTTGMTNPMTTTGDTIYSSSGSTPARLGIGSTGNVLTVSGGVPVWAAPAGGGGMTLISTTTLSGSTTSLTSIAGTYKHLLLIVSGSTATGNYQYTVRPNGTTGNFRGIRCNTTSLANTNNANLAAMTTDATSNNTTNAYAIWIYNYADSTYVKNVDLFGDMQDTVGDGIPNFARGIFNLTNAITSIDIVCTSTFNGGQALLYGVS
jgi:hypothetical protein